MRFENKIIIGWVNKVFNSIYDVSHSHEDSPDYLHTEEVESLELDFGGIVGNRHYGLTRIAEVRTRFMYKEGSVEIRNNAQWTAISDDELRSINKNLRLGEDELHPEHIGSNILQSGIKEFTATPRGYYLAFT